MFLNRRAAFFLDKWRVGRLRKNLFLSPVHLEALQFYRLKALIKDVYARSLYYRALFDRSGIRLKDIRSLKDLSRIPLTSKKDLIRLSPGDFCSGRVDQKRLRELRTSGTTGLPLSIFYSRSDSLRRRMSFLRMESENGRKMSDRMLLVVSPQHFVDPKNKRMPFYGQLDEKYISIQDDPGAVLEAARAYQPDIILSYASFLKTLASEALGRGIDSIRPRLIFSTAESLTPQDRLFLEKTFQAEVFDYYASSECGLIAWECRKHCGYHLDSDHCIVELTKDGASVPSGANGEVVVTSLISRTTPIIRYKLGDVCCFSDRACACGNRFPLIRLIHGRVNDHIVLPGGREISPYVVMLAMDKISGLPSYQVIQEDTGRLKVLLSGAAGGDHRVDQAVKDVFFGLLGRDLAITIEHNKKQDEDAPFMKKKIISSESKHKKESSNQ